MKKNHFLAAWLRPHLTTLCIRGPRAEEDAGDGRKDDAMITEEMEQAGRDGGAAGRSVLEAMSRFSTRSLSPHLSDEDGGSGRGRSAKPPKVGRRRCRRRRSERARGR